MGIREKQNNYRFVMIALLAMAAFLGSWTVARADSETIADPPRVQQAGNYTLEYLSAVNTDPKVGDAINFRFRVSDKAGKPIDNLNLTVTAIRNYSGQVKKEHNGPRTPNVGPVDLQPAGKPGEYQTTMSFADNGHWYMKIEGPSLGNASVQFRQPVATQANTEAGINWDWLIWPGIMLLVLGVVAIVRTGGEKFPVPTSELTTHLEGSKRA